jgi:hypothetical protein
MSAPLNLLRNAEEIGVGFLSSKASSALEKVLTDEEITHEERSALKEAARFLRETSQGASIASGSIIQGVSPSRSIAAFDLALGPIDTLKVISQQDALGDFFLALADAVEGLVTTQTATQSKENLRKAKIFFEALCHWVLAEANSRRGRSDLLSNGMN